MIKHSCKIVCEYTNNFTEKELILPFLCKEGHDGNGNREMNLQIDAITNMSGSREVGRTCLLNMLVRALLLEREVPVAVNAVGVEGEAGGRGGGPFRKLQDR